MPGDENRVRSEPKTSFRFKSVKQASEEMKEKSTGKKRSWKNAKQILAAEMYEVYPLTQPSCKFLVDTGIQASTSLIPSKKYCDLTGKQAKYTHPQTKLRFCQAEQFALIESMPRDVVIAYLDIRNGANSVIR